MTGRRFAFVNNGEHERNRKRWLDAAASDFSECEWIVHAMGLLYLAGWVFLLYGHPAYFSS